MRILLLEDDPHIGDGLYHGLSRLGLVPDWFCDGIQGAQALAAAEYDAAILDLSLPGLDGMDILKQWRKAGHKTPVLILTARNALPDRLAGLHGGADDYLCKPFELEEVYARLLALIRRSRGHADAQLACGALRLNTTGKSATLHGTPLDLTQREYLLLELLASRPTHIFSRAQIEDKLYGWEQEIDSNAVEVHIHNLRRKIGKTFIRTRRGLGYQIGDIP